MTKNIFFLVVVSIFIFSCSSKTGDMKVQGTIIGLQKGTLYLQKVQDSILVAVDSVKLRGTNTFELFEQNTEPQLFYLTLKEKTGEKIPFFGEKGTITINTKLSKFSIAAKIKGSKTNEILEDYQAMIQKFNHRRLEIFKESFDAQKEKDDELVEKLDKELKSLIKRRYLYSTNFSIKHKNSEVAPYIALTELFDANVSLLDTINNSLTKKVKKSLYGKKLATFIKDIKASEK